MRYLHKVFHELNSVDFEKVYHDRFHFETAIHAGLHIKPMKQSHVYPLYYIPTNRMLKWVTQIYNIAKSLDQTFHQLPPIARKQFVQECLIEELFHTNQLEGIESTKEEIAKSTREVLQNKKMKKRFGSMIQSYIRLLNHEFQLPRTPKDIRQIYDEITQDEIDPDELPDGEIFRKEVAYVLKKSGSGKVIHQGIIPESKIIAQMQEWLHFLNEETNIPTLLKLAISHYYFGYIHPFYDGNGRTSRFISSMYLSKELGTSASLSLSRGCNQYKNKYFEAFEVTNSFRNKGEMNHFIESFLEIIADALEKMYVELKEKDKLLQLAVEKMQHDQNLKSLPSIYSDCMFILVQHYFFDTSEGVTIRELTDVLEKSNVTVRKVVKELLKRSLIEQKGERPAYYCIRQEYFES